MRARRGLNLIEFYRGRTEIGLQFARDAARLGNDDIETMLARAEAYAQNAPEGLAEPLLNRVVQLDPGNQTAAWLRLIGFHRTNRPEDTARDADAYIRDFGDDPFVYVVGADAYEHLGDIARARDLYDRATAHLLVPTLAPGSVTAYDLTALLTAGIFHAAHDDTERAHRLWRRGLELSEENLAGDPEAVGMSLFRASFLGLLGDRPAFVRAETDAMALVAKDDLNPWELVYLAGAHAHLGNTARALDVLRTIINRGRLTGRFWMAMIARSLQEDPGYADVLRLYDDKERTRRRMYAPQ